MVSNGMLWHSVLYWHTGCCSCFAPALLLPSSCPTYALLLPCSSYSIAIALLPLCSCPGATTEPLKLPCSCSSPPLLLPGYALLVPCTCPAPGLIPVLPTQVWQPLYHHQHLMIFFGKARVDFYGILYSI